MPDEQKPRDATVLNTGVLGPIGTIAIPVNVDITEVLKIIDAATSLQTIEQYNALKPLLVKADSDLKTYLTRQDSQISSLQNQLTAAQTQISNLTSSNNDLTNQVAALNAQVAQLKAQLASEPRTALPLHVAQSFKNVVDQIQSDARKAGGVQTTITNMQIAVKALISVQPGTGTSPTTDAVLVFPNPSQPPDPNLLSTLTLNFGAIPNIKATVAPPPSPAGGGAPPAAAPGTSGPTPPPGMRPPSADTSGPPASPDAPPRGAAKQKGRKSITSRLRESLFGLRSPNSGTK